MGCAIHLFAQTNISIGLCGWESPREEARFLEGRRSASSDRLMVPEHVFALSEKPIRTLEGHSEDVLDLCWSKSQVMASLLFYVISVVWEHSEC
jgi:hypothetical protein